MKNLKEDIIAYRLKRARETFEDAEILAEINGIRLSTDCTMLVTTLLLHYS